MSLRSLIVGRKIGADCVGVAKSNCYNVGWPEGVLLGLVLHGSYKRTRQLIGNLHVLIRISLAHSLDSL
jgi:hypothetical protein